MKDETYAFISDVKEKNATKRSARNKRTHCGKGGRVRLPSDNLSKKELMKMNGECKSYRLNDPMAWKEFKAMPDDIKITYIKLLRQKFNVPSRYIAEMLGCNICTLSREINRLGISEGKRCRGRCTPWDKDGFFAWWHGVDISTDPFVEEPAEEPVIEEEPVHFYTEEERETIFGEANGYVEDDLPVEEPDKDPVVILAEECTRLDSENALLKIRIDELVKENEALNAQLANHTSDRQVIDKLRLMCSEYEQKAQILEAQMDVVRLIFGKSGC